MQPWQVVDLEGHLYYAFLPINQISKMKEEKPDDSKEDTKSKISIQDAEEEVFVVASDNDVTDVLNDFYAMKTENKDISMDEIVTADEDQTFNGEDNKVYACDKCNICFPEMQMLQCHQKAVHKEVKESITYKCKFCAYLSTNKSTIYSHVSRKHPTKRVIKRRNRRRNTTAVVAKPLQEYSCDACGFKCQSRRRLKEHLDRKHGSNYNYDCEYCGKKFKVKSDMRLHIRFKHKEGPIICDVCGKTCSNSNSLYVHQKWAHFKPEYECEICKRRMVTQENLDQHILLQHERRESFVCEECGKSFPENHRLKQHMMTHTGDRPYDCHICGKAFARRTAYRQHLLIHTGKRPYVCDICGKAFTQKPGLIGHRKSHPGDHPPLPVVYIDKILNDFMKKE